MSSDERTMEATIRRRIRRVSDHQHRLARLREALQAAARALAVGEPEAVVRAKLEAKGVRT